MCYSTLVSHATIKELNLVEDVDYHRIADADIVGDGELQITRHDDDTCFLTHMLYDLYDRAAWRSARLDSV
jgi:hypothetical protein